MLVAFGCGGERDHHKRPLMGAAAARGADVVVVTTDNPRREDPAAIADQVVSGVGSPMTSNLSVELDRRRAIETLLGSARDGDVVLVTGKGHESSQEIGTCKSAFDDREVVREILALPRRHADGHGGR